jgi:hypothetical protein
MTVKNQKEKLVCDGDVQQIGLGVYHNYKKIAHDNWRPAVVQGQARYV